MFTGLIIDVGRLKSSERDGDTRMVIECALDTHSVDIGASVCCNGVCLTVVDKGRDWFAADVSDETLAVTALGDWKVGTLINLERSLKLGDELGGHIVTGHVDGVGTIETLENVAGSMHLVVSLPDEFAPLVAKKGSIAVDGVSLTVNDVTDRPNGGGTVVSINLVPHTQQHTHFHAAKAGDKINLEFDILARYVARLQARN